MGVWVKVGSAQIEIAEKCITYCKVRWGGIIIVSIQYLVMTNVNFFWNFFFKKKDFAIEFSPKKYNSPKN